MKLSIITAVYNRVGTLAQALESLQSQQAQRGGGIEVEHIVIDGGSTDGSLELLREAERTGQLAVLVSEPDGGIYEALNKGLKLATGDVVGFLHSDDWLSHSGVLARVAAAFDDPAVQGVYGDLDYVSADGQRVIRRWRAGAFDPSSLARGWMPPHPTLFLRREVYEALGGFDTGLSIAADYEFILRWLTSGKAQALYIPEVLVKMRWGGASNRSLGHLWRKSTEDYRALRRHKVGGLATLARKNLGKLGQFLKK